MAGGEVMGMGMVECAWEERRCCVSWRCVGGRNIRHQR